MNKRNHLTNLWAPWLLVLVLFFPARLLFPALIEVMQYTVASGGDARGIAVKGYHVYLANGNGGLKIINLSNPRFPLTTGYLPLPDRFCDQVAISGNMVGLTDTDNNYVCFVDVKDRMRPVLKSALRVRGDDPRGLVLSTGKAFVIERGDHPAAPVYFSGVEVFDYSGAAVRSTQLTAIDDVRDVAATSHYLFVATGRDIRVFSRTATGFLAAPVEIVAFPAGEEMSSIALHNGYLFAFGTNRLYVIGKIPLLLPVDHSFSSSTKLSDKVPLSPTPGKEPGKKPVLKLKILVQCEIAGYTENRRIDAATIEFSDDFTSRPEIYLLLTTLKSYGIYIFNPTTDTLIPFEIPIETPVVFFDVYAASDREIMIYDAAFPEYFAPGWYIGGVMGIGALGSTGFGYPVGKISL